MVKTCSSCAASLLRDIGRPALHSDVAAAFAGKYTLPVDQSFLPLADPAFDVMYALDPVLALMWRLADYNGSQRRWRSSDTRGLQMIIEMSVG